MNVQADLGEAREQRGHHYRVYGPDEPVRIELDVKNVDTLLVKVFEAGPALFHSAWFVVSLLTELAVLMVLRTRSAAWRSRPAALLAWTTAAVAALALALPFIAPLARLFGFVPMSAALTATLVAIVIAYVLATEAAKRWFWRQHRRA